MPSPDALVHGSGEFWLKADLRIALDLQHPDGAGASRSVVQNAAGATDTTATAKLQAFINAKPGRIFYNDVPTGTPTATSCTTSGSYCNRTSYSPNLVDNPHVYPCAGSDLGLYPSCAAYIANETRSDGSLTARRGGFYSNREARWVYMLNVNLHDLLAWNRAQSSGNRLFDPDDTTEGGVVVFLTVDGTGSSGIPTPRYGVRVFGSPNLDFPAAVDPTGVTRRVRPGGLRRGQLQHGRRRVQLVRVVSEGADGAHGRRAERASNARGRAARRAGTTARSSSRSRRVRAPTRRSTRRSSPASIRRCPGTYNGGLENYPRFHETGRHHARLSRLVREPRHAAAFERRVVRTGAGCNIYNAPSTQLGLRHRLPERREPAAADPALRGGRPDSLHRELPLAPPRRRA